LNRLKLAYDPKDIPNTAEGNLYLYGELVRLEAHPELMNKYGERHQEIMSTLKERDLPVESVTIIQKPFAGYKNFADCVRRNQDKRDPEAYCGKIKHQVEGKKSEFEEKGESNIHIHFGRSPIHLYFDQEEEGGEN
jgi:hypothetical protein